jgi:hypothetical protein
MAKKTQKQEEPTDTVLTAAAKTIGKSAAKMVSAAAGAPQADPSGNNQEQQAPKISSRVPKLTKKNKSRLPRRQKKARQKAGTL